MFFAVVLFCKLPNVFLINGNRYGFGLYFQIKGRTCFFLLLLQNFFSFAFLKLTNSKGIIDTFLILCVLFFGHFWEIDKVFNFSTTVNSWYWSFSQSYKFFPLGKKVFLKQFLGWLELKWRYCFKSVGFEYMGQGIQEWTKCCRRQPLKNLGERSE